MIQFYTIIIYLLNTNIKYTHNEMYICICRYWVCKEYFFKLLGEYIFKYIEEKLSGMYIGINF